MEAKYAKAIKAGIIGGTVIVALIIFSSLLGIALIAFSYDNKAVYEPASFLLNLSSYALYLVHAVILLAVGITAVRMTASQLKGLGDAATVAALSGIVAGMIWSLVNIVLALIMPIITLRLIPLDIYGIDADLQNRLWLTSIVVGGLTNLLCCMPAILVFSITFALVGGILYAVLTLKK